MARRLVGVRVPLEVVAEMFVGSHRPGEWARRDGGLPVGAVCVGAGVDPCRNELVLTFEHESFPITRGGEVVPAAASPDWTTLHGEHLVAELAGGRLTVAGLAELLKCETRPDENLPVVVVGSD